MEPLTTFSLFCNIITTVDAVIRISRELKELYESSSGLASDKQRLQRETAQMRKIIAELNATRRKLPADPVQHPLIAEIAKECADLTDKINAILDECKAEGGRPKYIAVVKAWRRSRKKKPELDKLLSELQSTTQRLQTAIAAASQADLDSIKDQVYKHGVQQSGLAEKLTSIKDGLVSQGPLLQNMQQLVAVFEEAQGSIRHATILRALKPADAHTREDEIQEHHPKTLEWILKRRNAREGASSNAAADTDIWPASNRSSDMDFVRWLTDGSGVYHIAGKPGSGKSTLMKFLANEPVVRAHLERWAESTGKQLVFSKFFFWKYGSDDQKSVRGLLRGLLYDMAKDNMLLTKALFPRLWGDGKGWQLPAARDLTIKGSDIRAAFNRLRTDKDLSMQFRLCLFIDGLDEFDGKEMSHSRLAKELQAWTEDPDSTSFLKLCVSSREEHPIMSAFPACQRIHLQDLTRGDISAMVSSTLETSDFFLQLQKQDPTGSRALIASIVGDAEGVFLWVVLLLKHLEDELSSGFSSIAALHSIVRSTPKELEEFLGQILDSIHNYHKHGGYFILAMALRMMGIHLTDEGALDKQDLVVHETMFKNTVGPPAAWQPRLPLYGLAKVLVEFEKRNTSVESWPSPKRAMDGEYRAECLKGAGKIKSWCRGLLDAPNARSMEFEAFRDLNVRFAHRSIPDFLATIMSVQARKFGFTDDDIAQAILAVAIIQTVSTPSVRNDYQEFLAASSHHILLLLRLRRIPESSRIPSMLEDLDIARFEAWQVQRGDLHEDWADCQDPEILQSIRVTRPGDQQILVLPLKWAVNVLFMNQEALNWTGQAEIEDVYHRVDDYFSLNSAVLPHACYAGLDEFVRWKLDKDPEFKGDKALLYLCLYGLVVYFWVHGRWTRAHNSILHRLLAADTPFNLPFLPCPPTKDTDATDPLGIYPASFIREIVRKRAIAQQSEVNRDLSLWPVTVSKLLESLVLSTPAAVQLWEKLEVWLQFGAMPPIEITFERFDKEADNTRDEQLTRLFLQFSESDVESIGDHYAEADLDNPDVLGYVFFRLPVVHKGGVSSPLVEIWYFRTTFTVRKDNIGKLVPHMQTSGSITFRELVRYHNPPNAKRLLEYINRTQALIETAQADVKSSAQT